MQISSAVVFFFFLNINRCDISYTHTANTQHYILNITVTVVCQQCYIIIHNLLRLKSHRPQIHKRAGPVCRVSVANAAAHCIGFAPLSVKCHFLLHFL